MPIYDHNDNVNNFFLHMSEEYLQELMTDGLHQVERIGHIYVYHNNDEVPRSELKFSEKFSFRHGNISEGLLENAGTGTAVDPARQIDRSTINNIAISKCNRLGEKRRNSADHYSPESKRSASIVPNGRPLQNVVRPFICPGCETFFGEIYQLTCGHRLCHLCLSSQNNCTICSNVISKSEAQRDLNYENTKQQLLTTCLECNWEGSLQLYQEHVNQNHQDNRISNDTVFQNAQVSLHQSSTSVLFSTKERTNPVQRSETNSNATIDDTAVVTTAT